MKKNRAFHTIACALVFLAVMLNSSYVLITINDNIPIFFLALGVFMTSVMLFARMRSIQVDFAGITLFAFFSLFALIMVFHEDFSVWGSYVRQMLVMLLALNVAFLWDFHTMGEFFVKVMVGISFLSLALSALLQFTDIETYLPVVTNPNNAAYYNLWIVFARTLDSERCMGPFWEPGILATFLLIALLIEMCFLQRKPSWKTITLFIVTILMTLSTAGYILLLVVLLIGLNSMYPQRISIYLNAICLVALSLIAYFSEEILNHLAVLSPLVFQKMTFGSASMLTRVNGPYADFTIWMQNIWTGVGVKEYQNTWALLASGMNLDSRTSTITYFLAVFGVGGLLFVLWVLRGCLRQRGMSLLMRFALMAVFVSFLTKEPHYYNVAMMTVLMYLNRDMLATRLASIPEAKPT